MKTAIIIGIACLVLTGVVSASGVVPAIPAVRNTSLVTGTVVPTPQPTGTTGFIGNLIAPIVHILPTATATPAAPVVRQAGTTNIAIASLTPFVTPDPGGLSPAQKVENMQLQQPGFGSATDPCGDPGSLRVMHGKMDTVYVQDTPGPFRGGVLLEHDGKLYTLVSANNDVYTLMQTAFASDREVSVAGYPGTVNPGDGFQVLFTPYKVCWMTVRRA